MINVLSCFRYEGKAWLAQGYYYYFFNILATKIQTSVNDTWEKTNNYKAGKTLQSFVRAFTNNRHNSGSTCAGTRHSPKRLQH